MPIYMKYEGIEGSATGTHKGWIELESCQLGSGRGITSPTGRGSNREGSAPSVSEIGITKYQDSSSTHLFREALSGAGKKVTIDFTKSDGTVYMKVELEGTLISNYNVSGHGGDSHDKPMEFLSLNFTKITFTVTAADPTSSKDTAMWNLATP